MDTKDTGIKQEPTAPGAEGNDGSFPQNNPAECGVCFILFDDTDRRPRTLPCGHTFCTECIKVMMTTGNLTCPSCRNAFKTEKINQFPVNYMAEDFIKLQKAYTLPKPSQNTIEGLTPSPEGSTSSKNPGTPAGATFSTITPSLKNIIDEQKTNMESGVTDRHVIQSHLDQYESQMGQWRENHKKQLNSLNDLVKEQKYALDLLEQEDCRLNIYKKETQDGIEQMEETIKKIQSVDNGEEALQVINQACHYMDEDKDWKKKYQELFPDVTTVITSKKVRDVTEKALMMVDGEAGATQHTNQLSDLTLPLMDKVNILLNDNESEELEEVKPDNRENQNDDIYFKVTKEYVGRTDLPIYVFHCLQNQNLPPDALTMPVSEMVKRLHPNYTFTFLDLAWSGRRGRVYIEVDPTNTTEARQFVDLCTGQRGSSFFNTRLTRVWNKGKAGECVFGGNYDSGVNRMLLAKDRFDEGTVMFMPHTDKIGEFIISTNTKCPEYGIIIGEVLLDGLNVLKEAVQLSDITQVTVVDCGVGVCA